MPEPELELELEQLDDRKFTINFTLPVTPGLTRGLVGAVNIEVPDMRRKSGLSGMTKREMMVS